MVKQGVCHIVDLPFTLKSILMQYLEKIFQDIITL